MDSFWTGFEKRATKVVYHGSPRKLKIIRPRNEHGDPGVNNVVFATPNPQMVAAYLGKKWGDRDINQSGITSKSTGKTTFRLEEMRPGAFDDTYKGQKGYLYTLPASDFTSGSTLGSRSEVVSTKAQRPLSVKEIPDVLSYLHEVGVDMRPYNPNARTHQTAVSRMARRVGKMPPSGQREYLNWVQEANPDLADKIKTKLR